MLALALCLTAWQTPLDRAVTFEGEPARVEAILADLGQQAGIKIIVRGAPERDYAYVNIFSRSLRSSLDLMASACQSEWREDAGRIIFSAPWPVPDEIDEAHRTAMVQKWLDANPVPPKLAEENVRDVMDELTQLEGITEATDPRLKRIEILKKNLPIERMSLQVLHAMGAKEIAATTKNQISLYMTQSHGRIRAVPPSVAQTLVDFRSEATAFGESLSAKGFFNSAQERKHVTTVEEYQHAQFGGLDEIFVTIKNQAGVLFIVINMAGGSGAHIRKSIAISLTAGMKEDSLLDSLTTPFAPPETWKSLVPVSKPSEWPIESTPELRDRVLNLDADEVLTDFADDVFRQLAQSEEKDVVAVVPDHAFLWIRPFATNPAPIGKVIQQLYGSRCVAQEESDALIFSPDDLAQARQNRVPRKESARLLRTLFATGKTPLDQLTAVALASEGYALENTLDLAARTFKFPVSYSGQTETLRAYGLLSSDQKKQAAESGLAIKFASLTPRLRQVVESMLYGGQLGTMLFVRPDKQVVYGVHNSAQFVMPLGVPDDAVVSFLVKNEPVLYGLNPEVMGRPTSTTLFALANSLVAKQKGTLNYELPELFAEVEQGKVELAVTLNDGTKFQTMCQFNGMSHLTQYKKLSEMPKDFRDRLQAEMIHARKRAGGKP